MVGYQYAYLPLSSVNDLLFFLIGSALTLSVAVAVRRLGNIDGASDWLLGWVSILVAGLNQMFVGSASVISFLAPAFDSLFAGFLLSGTLRFVGKTHHLTTLWAAVLLITTARCITEPFVSFGLGPFSATLLIALASIISADLLLRYSRHAGLPATRTFSLVFLLPAFAQLNFAWFSVSQPDLTTAFFLWLMAGSLLIMVQLFLLIEKARFQAQLSREALATMAEAAPVGLCLTTPQGEIRASNQVARRLLDIRTTPDLPLQDLLVARSNLGDGDFDAADDGFVARFESEQSVAISRAPITPENWLVGYAWFFHQLAADQPAPGNARPSRQLASLQEVAGSFAHVINNRLMVISGSAELIGISAPEHCRTHLDRLTLAVDQCAQTTSELLRIVERSLQPGSTQVGEAIRNLASSQLLEVEVELGDTEHLELDVSETAFATAFGELMESAVQAGAANAHIVSSRAEQDGFVAITVASSGGPTHDSRRKGADADAAFSRDGFSIAAGIIESRGGEIRRDHQAQGTRFLTLWPLTRHTSCGGAEPT